MEDLEKQQKIQQARCRTAVDTLTHMFGAVIRKKKPLDRELSSWFRNHTGIGSRDRRLLGDLVFSFFRHWGWLRKVQETDPTGEKSPRRKKNWTAWTEPDWQQLIAVAAFLADIKDPLPASLETPLQSVLKNGEKISMADKVVLLENLFQISLSTNQLMPTRFRSLYYQPEQFDAFLEAQLERPPVWLRCNTVAVAEEVLKELSATEVECERVGELAIKISGRFNINNIKAYNQGQVEVQDFASQTIGKVCAPSEGERWWDTCAGSGGKSLQLYAMLQGKGSIQATDNREHAIKELKKRTDRAKIRLKVGLFDLLKKDPDKEAYDGVLVDVPCSNSGTWRRNPDLRLNFDTEKVKEVAELQFKLLDRAAVAVKPGGVLVYSTCSVTQQETFDNVERFLKAHPEFKGDTFPHPLKDEMVDTCLPLTHDLNDNDSMFVARFTRK